MLRQLQFAKFIMACVVVASSLGLGVPAAHAMGSGDKTPPGYTQTNYPLLLCHWRAQIRLDVRPQRFGVAGRQSHF